MEQAISTNALIQAIYSVQLNIKRHRDLLEGDGVAEFSEEVLEERGETLLALMQTTSELGAYYDEQRELYPQLGLPSYTALCQRFVFW